MSLFSHTAAMGMSIIPEGTIGHDEIIRFSESEELTSKKLWTLVRKTVKEVESEEGVIIIVDTIEEKPNSEENEIVNWHFDNGKARFVIGVNILSALYYSNEARIPVGFEVIKKPEQFVNESKQDMRRKSKKMKDQVYRNLLNVCVRNGIKFKYVLNDFWYDSSDNIKYIKEKMKKDFIIPLNENRKIALSKEDRLRGSYFLPRRFRLRYEERYEINLEGVEFPFLLIKQVCKNENGSEKVMYLISSDITLTYDQMTKICQKKWNVE